MVREVAPRLDAVPVGSETYTGGVHRIAHAGATLPRPRSREMTARHYHRRITMEAFPADGLIVDEASALTEAALCATSGRRAGHRHGKPIGAD